MVFKLLGLTLIRFRLIVFLWYIWFLWDGNVTSFFLKKKKNYKQYMHLSITLDDITFLFTDIHMNSQIHIHNFLWKESIRLSQSVSDHQGHWCEF
jgi:hypothetical protein